MKSNEIKIDEWTSSDTRWLELEQFFDLHKEGMQEIIRGYDQRDSRVLVASIGSQIVGLLRLIIIPIGPDNDLPAVKLNGRELIQAKVMNFFVLPEFRGGGLGRRLQQAAIALAKSLSCYQLVSFSYDEHKENHSLKLSMGYAVQPEFRQNGRAHGLFFVMPLQVPDETPD